MEKDYMKQADDLAFKALIRYVDLISSKQDSVIQKKDNLQNMAVSALKEINPNVKMEFDAAHTFIEAGKFFLLPAILNGDKELISSKVKELENGFGRIGMNEVIKNYITNSLTAAIVSKKEFKEEYGFDNELKKIEKRIGPKEYNAHLSFESAVTDNKLRGWNENLAKDLEVILTKYPEASVGLEVAVANVSRTQSINYANEVLSEIQAAVPSKTEVGMQLKDKLAKLRTDIGSGQKFKV